MHKMYVIILHIIHKRSSAQFRKVDAAHRPAYSRGTLTSAPMLSWYFRSLKWDIPNDAGSIVGKKLGQRTEYTANTNNS